MKKLLFVIVPIVLVVWVASWFWDKDAVMKSAARPWPVKSTQTSQQKANDASVKLTALVKALPRNEAVDAFVAHETARGELAIGRAPAVPDVSAIRELLLNAPVVWQREEGIGGGDEIKARRRTVMTAARALVADALVKESWDDLHAAWKLARSLDDQPQMMMQTAALAVARTINAAAWKMPLPVPAWFAEVQERDNVRPLLESFHFQTAEYVKNGTRLFPTKMLANLVDHDRRIAEEVANTTTCDVKFPMNEIGVDLSFIWRRAFRYRAEREATANALRVRAGKPIEPKSACSDGGWTFDGKTLRFSREIPTAPPDQPMPLALAVVLNSTAVFRPQSGAEQRSR